MLKKSGLFEPVLLLSLAQLLLLPELGAHSALFLAGEAMRADPKSQHLVKLMNGVLREAQRRQADVAITPETLFPPELLVDVAAAYGEAAIAAFGAGPARGGPTRSDPQGGLPDPRGSAARPVARGHRVRIVERDRAVEQLPGYADGRFWVQDAAAAIPARLMQSAARRCACSICVRRAGRQGGAARQGRLCRHGARARPAARRAARGQSQAASAMPPTSSPPMRSTYTRHVPFRRRAARCAVLGDRDLPATSGGGLAPRARRHRSEPRCAPAAADRQALPPASCRAACCLIWCVCSLQPEEGEAQAGLGGGQGLEPRADHRRGA